MSAVDRSSDSVETPWGSKPGSAAPANRRARTNRTATTINNRLSATCPTTNVLRKRVPAGDEADSFKAVVKSTFDALNAGASPDTRAAESDNAAVKATTRQSSVTGTFTGNGNAGIRGISASS